MNHSVKSKTIRHDCHLLVSAAPAPPATCLVLQRFKPNRHDWNPCGGRAAGSPEPQRLSPKTSCFVFYGGSRLEGPAATSSTHHPTRDGSNRPVRPILLFPRCHFWQRRMYLHTKPIKQQKRKQPHYNQTNTKLVLGLPRRDLLCL